MRLVINRCDDLFGRVSMQNIEVSAETSMSQIKSQLATHLRVSETQLALRTIAAGETEGRELTDSETVTTAGLRDGDSVNLTISQLQVDLQTETLQTLEEEEKVQPTKTKSQWLSLLLQLCNAGNLSVMLRLLSDYEREVSAHMIEVDEDELISKPGAEGWTPLHYACNKGHTRIVQALCSRKCCPNIVSKDQWTPLQLATYHGHTDCVKTLLKHEDVHVNRMTRVRPPPLHIAAAKGFDEIVERLLQKDASTTLEGPDGKYPLELTNKPEILEMLPKYQGDKVLKAYSGNLPSTVSDFYGKVMLTGAMVVNDKEMFLSLNATNGDLNFFDSQDDFLAGKPPTSSVKLVDIYGIKECNPGTFSERGKFYFILVIRERVLKLYTEHDGLTAEWIKRIRQGINLALEHRMGMEYSGETVSSRPSTPVEDGNRMLRHSTMGLADLEEDSQAHAETGMRETVNFSSFAILEELGSGSFGKVYKVVKNDSKRVYAIKCLSKQFLIKQKQLQYAISECKILKRLSHPFILHLHYAFQTQKNLYMVLDYCPNGDLLSHLQERLKFGESVCRFYCSEILLALEYLHSLDIVYRDLKPENILLDQTGHVLMADFGLAKENVNSMNPAMSFCGSPAYLAPDLLNKQGSEKSADVYSFGAIMYEMLTGLPPFYSENIKELFKNIRNAQLQFPASVRPEAKDLIKKVMNRDASKRPTISQLKHHPFFREVDWEATISKKVRPPRLGPSWKQSDEQVEGEIIVDYNAVAGLVIDEDYKDGEKADEVDEFNY